MPRLILVSVLAAVAMLAGPAARAAETQTLPKGAFMLDVGYMYSTIDQRWDDARTRQPLLDSIKRYEPGAGWQGTITANPEAVFHIVATQILYGLTDDLSLAVALPVVVQSKVRTNLGWSSGDYHPQLGRSYTEEDFWAWAGSMGQGRPPGEWTGNKGALADMILGARYRLPQPSFLEKANIDTALFLQVALPTGRSPDPEEMVAVGTTAWELHTFGDVEAHFALSRPFMRAEGEEVDRITLGADVFYAILRPRTYQAPRGTKNPLLLNQQPYIGDTYVIDPGNWFGGSLTLEVSPLIGPTRASIVSGGSLDAARKLPPMLTLSLGYSYTHTNQSDWQSESPMWDWDREKLWLPGDKNALKAMATLSLLRVGLPVQLYASYRSQTLIPGRNTRPSNVLNGGMKVLLKFW